jgi:Domain of unknown function (DUF4158)
LKLDPVIYAQYDWEGGTVKAHRAQIREQLSFREATALDTEEMKSWLIAEHLASDQHLEHLKVNVLKGFRACKIKPPTNERLERLIHSACTTYEQQFFEQVLKRLPCGDAEAARWLVRARGRLRTRRRSGSRRN